ncbi:MAG: hypothetical protein GWM98_26510 [Nitrospinaceae bacterium]|nr:DUF2284 domain-containing protein [Nitrospinaceae bacterium]NIR57375.1 DUF2284 domain-containing protein [Nitrospinaceae bacterium]NIS87827.1 DUF2284 domain-containing protein [Nitrospinaceae bacterium]NIT84697.1 DUF2284 domain-containing protein [Nitrospinaceae bacterium]NIU46876.1 DUF2284 domain-containing protein [Nitrospinaceae bacterium]
MTTEFSKIRSLPLTTRLHQELIEDAINLGCVKAKVIPIKSITLGHWVKLQCQYGCSYFGKRFTCPSLSPTSDEMSEILLDYEKALIIQTRHSSEVHTAALELENSFKKKGYYKAFALEALPCNLCEECTIESYCLYPEKARPTLQACGIDVPHTLNNIGWEMASASSRCSDHQAIGMILVD